MFTSHSTTPASSPSVEENQANKMVVTSILPHARPQHWEHWQVQIDQMIPAVVNLRRHVIFDWHFDLQQSASAVDVYVYDSKAKKLNPMVRIDNPDLSFSRRMEDAVAAVDSVKADIIRDVASNGHRLVGTGPIVVYKNKQIQSPKMFGPTIDTLMMCAAIEQRVDLGGKDQAILEVGTGNGMIAKMLLHKFHDNLEKLFVTDLSAVVLTQAAQNILSLDLAENHKDKLVTVRDATFLKTVNSGALQLIVSNPPYIPDFRDQGMQLNHAITGLEVYRAVLGEWGHRALHDDGKVLMILSSVSAKFVRELLQEQALFEEKGVLAQKLVPFDLADINLDSKYMNRLLQDNLVFEINGRCYHLVEVVEFAKRMKTLH